MIEPIPRPDRDIEPAAPTQDIARPPATGLHHAECDGHVTRNDAAEAPKHPEVPETRPLEAGIEFSFDTSFDKRDDTNEFRAAPASALTDLPQIPNYEVQSVLGRGGMGVVLKARHRVLGRIVAIKLPLVGQFVGAEERERFLREARAAARLHHRQICPIHEVGQIEGRPYLVLQFLAGKTLHEWSAERKPSARESASLLARVARAVGYAHQHGVVHRDLKPANVMIEAESDEPVLMDFGLAKELGDEASLLTQTGQVMGTPAYMAPEQAAGRVHEVGPPSDIYALGAILYELICGQRPFLGGAAEVLRQVVAEEPAAPRTLNPRLHIDLETICLKALAKNPGERYETAIALADDLERFAAGEPILARRQPLWRKMARRVRRSPGVAVALTLAVIAVVLGGYFATAARNASRLANLKSQFEQSLERGQWSDESLSSIDALVAEIAQLERLSTNDLADRVRSRLAGDIEREITDTPPRQVDLRRASLFEERIALLDPRDRTKADELRRLVKEYLGGWKAIFDLSPASSDLGAHFDAAQVKHTGGVFKAYPAVDATGQPRVLSKTEAAGPARLEAEFDANWETARQVGLLLSAGRSQEYAFVVSAPEEISTPEHGGTNSQAPTLADARRRTRQFAVHIYRRSVLFNPYDAHLKGNVVPADDYPGGPLRLRATRDGDRLTFEINSKAVLECVDVFPLAESGGDAFGLRWPGTVGVVSLTAERLLRPQSMNPLEQADQLFARGAWNEARQLYEKSRLRAGDERRQEIEYKTGLCDLAENAVETALRRFDELQQQPGLRWPLLAACQIWLDKLKQKDFEAANAQFDLIKAKYRDSTGLALALPEKDRLFVIGAYGVGGGERIQFDKSISDRSKRVEEVLELVGADGFARQNARMDVIQSLAQEGSLMEALRKAEAYLSGLPAGSGEAAQIILEYGWVARVAGAELFTPLGHVDESLYQRPGLVRPAMKGLFVERARLHAAQQAWAAAEADLDEFDRVRTGLLDPDGAWAFAAAEVNLVRGFLRERRGDIAAAHSAWREGYQNLNAAKSVRLSLGDNQTPLDILTRSILASLTETPLTDEEYDLCFELVKVWIGGRRGLAAIVNNANLMRYLPKTELKADVLTMWRSPHSRPRARRMALRSLSRQELIRQSVLTAFSERLSRAAFAGVPTEEQSELAWITSEQLARAALDNRLDGPTLLGIGATWNGGWTVNVLWQTAKKGLESQPELRALLAYIIGERLLLKGQSANADLLFRSALDDAASFTDPEVGATLAKLAQFELEHISDRKEMAALAAESKTIANQPTSSDAKIARKRLMGFWRQHHDTPLGPAAYKLASEVTWPADLLRRSRIPPEAVKSAGFGESDLAPRELVFVLIGGHPAVSLAWSPDGAALATGYANGITQLFNTTTGEPVRSFGAAGAVPWSIRFNQDGSLLAAGRSDGKVVVWDAASGAIAREWTAHPSEVTRIAFNPAGDLLVSADNAGAVKLWKVADGAPAGEWKAHNGNVTGLAFMPEGKVLVTGGSDTTIRMWNLQGNELPAIEAPAAPVVDLAVDPTGRWLAAVENSGAVKLWGLGDRKLQFAYPKPNGTVLPNRTITFSPDGQSFAAAGSDGQVRIYDPRYYEDELPFPQTAMAVGPPGATIRQAVYSPDGRHLATANGDGTTYILRLAAPR